MANNITPEFFRYIPRNDVDNDGGVVLFDAKTNVFYKAVFGVGENLDEGDIEQGYDDYLMVDSYRWNGQIPLIHVVNEIKHETDLEEIDGLEPEDGAMYMFKLAEHNNSGDIRTYLAEAIDMVSGDSQADDRRFDGIMFVCEVE